VENDYQHIAYIDSHGHPLEGETHYKLQLPPAIPAASFWSVIVYDRQTRLIIRNDQMWPSVHSNCRNLGVNPDGSVDVWFGPGVRTDQGNNWIQTIPGKGWYMVLNLYDPLEAWFDKTWKPGEIEELKF